MHDDVDRPRFASARRREIYLQASRLFVERGYDATSMADIAEAVKITKAGLYHFVKGKEDLLFTIISFGMDELEAEVVEPARQVEDARERLEFMIRAHLHNIGRVGSKSGNPVTLVVDEPWGLTGEKRDAIAQRKLAYFNLIRSTLHELQADGRVRPEVDTSVAAHSIIGMILWTARWRRPGGRLSVEAIVDQIVALAMASVAA